VSLIDEFLQLKKYADLDKTKTGKVLTCKEYLSQLHVCYSSLRQPIFINIVTHNVVSHNITYSDDDSIKNDDVYDMDACVTVISANIMYHLTKSANIHGKNDVWMHHDKNGLVWMPIEKFVINLITEPTTSYLDMKKMDLVLP
jgi:hypothetical protein